MKIMNNVIYWFASGSLSIFFMLSGLRSCSNYQIENENLSVNSRATGYYHFMDKIEYSKLKDGSEEVMIRDGDYFVLYQNVDGDDKVDRIRKEEFITRDIFVLEDILVRSLDYSLHKSEFNEADKILIRERTHTGSSIVN